MEQVNNMTDEQIQHFIDTLNSGEQTQLILKQLSERVYWAAVWELPATALTNLTRDEPQWFYFVKNEKQFVAAVFDMGHDLHWFTLPNHRGKGHLSNALRNVILNHLTHYHNRDKQRITISRGALSKKNFQASCNLAQSIGFVEEQEGHYFFQKPASEAPTLTYNGLDDTQREALKLELIKASSLVTRVATKLELEYGQLPSVESLQELSKQVFYGINRLEDILYEQSSY